MIPLLHNKIQLALHPLREARGPTLLLLHGLGERTPATLPASLEGWPGSVFGLDFTGHGASSVPGGGGYTGEILMGDADAALAKIGPASVFGRGLGAWVALLVAGGRPELVRGAILADGPGLVGGGPAPGATLVAVPEPGAVGPPDPFALVELALDVRPPDYATSFVRQANELSKVEPAIVVAAIQRPEWLRAVANEPGVEELRVAPALRSIAAAAAAL